MSLFDLFVAVGMVIDEQEVECDGRWIVAHPGFVPSLRHMLLVRRQRAKTAARRLRRRHQRCGAKP